MERARQLESDLIDWTDEVEQNVQSMLETFEARNPPVVTSSGSAATGAATGAAAVSSAIDSDNVENEHLPPPLTPQVFAG